MRTTKRFTPQVLARFERQGRGLGTFQSYSPWHQVTRGDPASQGRSHLLYWRERLLHLLSDLEWGGQLFGVMLPGVVDSTEQKRLSLAEDVHPLAAYTTRCCRGPFPGTLELSQELGIKHPRVCGGGDPESWTPTTDLVLVLQDERGQLSMLAVAIKPEGWSSRKRDVELLRLEREYWLRRSVQWLLITPEVWTKSVVLTLRRMAPWSLAEAADSQLMHLAKAIACERSWASVTWVIERMERHVPCRHACQCAFWQAVSSGQLPLDLSRGWRPQEPLRLLSSEAFVEQNPIASRRSAWI